MSRPPLPPAGKPFSVGADTYVAHQGGVIYQRLPSGQLRRIKDARELQKLLGDFERELRAAAFHQEMALHRLGVDPSKLRRSDDAQRS